MMKFNKFFVTDGTIKARVSYHLDNRFDGRKCVTLYAKDYSRELGELFPEIYKNDTDSQVDYFERGRVVIFEDHPCYEQARNRALQSQADWETKQAIRKAKWAQAATA